MLSSSLRFEGLLLCALLLCAGCGGDAPEGPDVADAAPPAGAIDRRAPDAATPSTPDGGGGTQRADAGTDASNSATNGEKDSGIDAGKAGADAGSASIDAGNGGTAGSGGTDAGDGGAGGIVTPAGCMGTKPDVATAKVCTANDECEEAFPIASCNHDNTPIDYPDRPPAGGDHNPCWGTWGVHAQPLAAERWVHNLEHGAVVLLYNCPSGCASEIDQLAAFVDAPHTLTVLTAYTAMAPRFALVSWGYRLSMQDELDLDAVQAFYDAHVDHAPEHIASAPSSACADSE